MTQLTEMWLSVAILVLPYLCDQSLGSSGETCSCYPLGTQEDSKAQSICKIDTLQCKCLPHVVGLNCDKCEDDYYNILSGVGCMSCQCNPEGTKANTTCDSRGRCECKNGYKGYRCNQRITDESCVCNNLLESSTQLLISQLANISNISQGLDESDLNNTNFNVFKRRLSSLKDSIEKLYNEIVEDPLKNYDNQISSHINKSRQLVDILIATSLKQNNANLTHVTLKYETVLNLSEICRQKLNDTEKMLENSKHRENATLLSKNAYVLLEELLNVVSLLSDIESSYEKAEQNLQDISSNITNLRNKYLEKIQEFREIKNISMNAVAGSKKTKASAITNRELLQDIHFTINNKPILCGEEIPDYKTDFEERLENRLKNCSEQQNVLEELFNEIRRAQEQAVRLEEQNERDNASLNTVYKDALNLLGNMDLRIVKNIQNIENLNDENENNLLILQDELEHLIRKLEMFSLQLTELDILHQRNLEFLEDLQNKVNTSKTELVKLKELDAVIAAVPISEEELNNVEQELNKANLYFQLQQQIEEMEKEVNLLGNVALQLEELPTNLCNAEVHPEGKLP